MSSRRPSTEPTVSPGPRPVETPSPTNWNTAFERAVLAAALDPVVTIDAAGTIQSVSDSIERVFGWKPGELVGQNVRVLMPEPHRSAHDHSLSVYLATGNSRILGRRRTFDALRKDGTPFPIELCVSRADIPGRESPVFVGIIRDISVERRAELGASLVKSLALNVGSAPTFNEALNGALSAVCLAMGWDYAEAWLSATDALHVETRWTRPGIDSSALVAASAAHKMEHGTGFVGHVEESGTPQVYSDFRTQDDRRRFRRAQAALDAGFVSVLGVPVHVRDQVAAVLCFFSRAPIPPDDPVIDLIRSAVAPVGPLLRQRQLEDALRLSEAEFRAAFELSAVAKVLADPASMRIMRVNSKFCELTGYSERELVGMSFLDITHPDDRSTNIAQFRRAADLGQALEVEKRYICKDGQTIWVRVTSGFIRDPLGKPYRTITVVQDITESKRAEQEGSDSLARLEELVRERTEEVTRSHEQLRLADRMASIGTLAAGLGHDMNNVLLPVRARLNALLAHNAVPPSSRSHVEGIRRSVAYLQQLADGLHYLALNPDREDASQTSTDLREWWSQTGLLLAKAAPKHVKVTASFPDDLPEVPVPAHGLTQAVLNLVVNAGEAIPPDRKRRQGRVRVWAELSKNGHARVVRLGVSDNGAGMSDEVRRRAFEMFFTTKRRGLGTGLGLALVRQVALRAGGNVQLDSKLGKGTSVVLVLPAAVKRARSTDRSPKNAPLAVLSLTDKRAAALIEQILQSSGVQTRQGEMVEGARIWVLEPATASPAAVKAWLARCPEGRLVLHGEPTRSRFWNALDPIIIHEMSDFAEIRAAIGQAIS